MKLDVNVLRYVTKDEFRVLTATEMGMKNVCDTFLATVYCVRDESCPEGVENLLICFAWADYYLKFHLA